MLQGTVQKVMIQSPCDEDAHHDNVTLSDGCFLAFAIVLLFICHYVILAFLLREYLPWARSLKLVSFVIAVAIVSLEVWLAYILNKSVKSLPRKFC